jgi:hemerythrin-like domain-containing protein
MLPIGPLMIEHRLIERMIAVMKSEIERFERENSINPQFIDTAVDFIRTYADYCHHGKEEDILFRDLSKKALPAEQKSIMAELLEEHRQGRKAVRELIEAKERYVRGDKGALFAILDSMRFMTDFYPQHIEKEDRHFFMPCMAHFSQDEKYLMLKEEWEFDRKLIHKIYQQRVEEAERFLPRMMGELD